MDRRVFQPEPGSGAHRRSALGLSTAVLLAGGLGLASLNGGLGRWWSVVLLALLGAFYLYVRLKRRTSSEPEPPAARPRRRRSFPAAPPEQKGPPETEAGTP